MKHKITALSTLLLAGCVSNSDLSGRLEQWKTFDNQSYNIENTSDLSEKEAKIIFIRENVPSTAINIFINGEYLTSLLNNAYKPIVVCADNQQLTVAYNENDNFNNRYAGLKYDLKPQSVTFIRVVENHNEVSLKRLPEEEGKALLANLPQQNHVLPRVERKTDCNVKAVEHFILEAGALFPLNKSAEKDMLEKGRNEIRTLLNAIKEHKATISKIKVVGYTDPEGSNKINKPLSYHRAETVKSLLQQGGLTAPIEAVGLADENLLVGNCRALHPKNSQARAACNQPNRRVEIMLYSDIEK
ncbi:hypothetical protein A1D23_07600 [Chelonobacter oris]|uniref:OmpA family protein n=1 Tax=Chelonobacter oris TaxID=505317 RepID=UPI002447B425|nr:OmpA family protein [Chelonobacter oris]MDH2999951.1 hypothetical protein [Chelonobacter oris]